jgi:hypothetical protein
MRETISPLPFFEELACLFWTLPGYLETVHVQQDYLDTAGRTEKDSAE